MSKPKIIKILQKSNPSLSREDLDDILRIFSNDIIQALKEGKKIELRGFGTFFLKRLKEKRNARNPKTSEIIYVPEKNKVRFKASKKLKKIINS